MVLVHESLAPCLGVVGWAAVGAGLACWQDGGWRESRMRWEVSKLVLLLGINLF